jgi:hypothetical protein
MSLTVFLAFCILGLAFMIYFLFKLLFGDRRSLIVRRVAAQRKAAEAEAARAEASGLIFVPAEKSTPTHQGLGCATGSRSSDTEPRKVFPRSSYTTRIA